MDRAVAGKPPVAAAAVTEALPHLRATTMRTLTALLRCSDAELALPSRTGVGSRRRVVARLARHAERTTRALEDRADRHEATDRLLELDGPALVAAVTAALGGVLGALREHGAGARGDAEARERAIALLSEHLAWLELSHVDLDCGYAMHDVPDASLDAIAAHFRAARAGAQGTGASPFASLVTD